MSDSFATPRTAALQALLSMGFFRQKYWSGLLCPPPGHLPDPGIEHASIPSPALTGRFFTTSATWEVQVKSLSHVRLFPMPWTVAHQASPSMEFSRHEYWSGLPFPSPGDLPNPGIEPGLPHCRQTLYHLSHFLILKQYSAVSLAVPSKKKL